MQFLSEKFFNEAVESLQRMIRIKSVEGKAKEGMPFGEGPLNALHEMLSIGKELGFRVYNHKNMAGHIEMGPDTDEYIGIVAHLDVVPEGSDWIYPPYGAEIHDGFMYGRGTVDDKGPAMASLYAMKALKELKVPLKRKVRLILGTNEETGSKGVEAYFQEFPAPFMGFTPDADFPAIFAEYGILTMKFCMPLKEGRMTILELKGGEAHNMVPDRATVLLKVQDQEETEKLLKSIDCEVPWDYAFEGENLRINVIGVSAHGSTPYIGKNAISYLMKIVSDFDAKELSFANVYLNDFAFSDGGEKLGVDFEDEISGHLRMNPGVIKLKDDKVQLVVNVRYPVTFKAADVVAKINENLTKDGFVMEREYSDSAPLYYPQESPLIQKLMKVYQRCTGDHNAKPIAVGGGTYARETKNIVAFGPSFPGDEEVIHQKNERISLSHYQRLIEIYTDAIGVLAKE